MSPYKLVATAAAILMSGCSTATEADQASAGSANQPGATNPASSSGPAAAAPEMRANETRATEGPASDSASLLENSIPPDGARLSASPENLVLNFRSPVRLQEVTVLGSDGQSVPMMITAAGSVRSFSIPMPDLEPGSYTVRWRATGDTGSSLEGSLGFVIA